MRILCGAQGDFESDVLRLSFSSLATPPTTIDYNMATGKQCVAPARAEPVGACVMKPLTLRTGACPYDAMCTLQLLVVCKSVRTFPFENASIYSWHGECKPSLPRVMQCFIANVQMPMSAFHNEQLAQASPASS